MCAAVPPYYPNRRTSAQVCSMSVAAAPRIGGSDGDRSGLAAKCGKDRAGWVSRAELVKREHIAPHR